MLKYLYLFLLAFFLNTTFAQPLPTFEPAEHADIGDQIKLYFYLGDKGVAGQKIHLPNGLALTFGDAIAMGDFYEILGLQLSDTKTDIKKENRFVLSVNSFATDVKTIAETEQILAVIHQEKQILDDGMRRGERPETIYEKLLGENNRQFNCITGGGCETDIWWLKQGRYLKLSNENYDHFGDDAWQAYRIGHGVALKAALIASRHQDRFMLEYAYAFEAFADHFLSDRFASGHMRTPRKALSTTLPVSLVGSLLANYMHDEESLAGLHVHNRRGDHWIAFGDQAYFDMYNEANKKILREALQQSVQQVFDTYVTKKLQDKTADILQLLPEPDENESNNNDDIAPLFYWNAKENVLYRRTNISNINDHHWTASWWSWSTLAILAAERGLPILSQQQLIADGLVTEALQYGLITDKTLLFHARR